MISTLRKIDRWSWSNQASGVYLLLAVPLYFNYAAYDSTLWEKFLVAHIVAIRMAIGWLGASSTDRVSNVRGMLDLPILLYLGLSALSWLSAINPLKSGMEVIRILLAATIYFSVSRTYKPSYRDVWLGAASLSLALVSVAGILQYLGLGFLDWRSAGLPSSTFFYRNYAAMFVAIVLPLTLCAVALSRDSTAQTLHAVAGSLGSVYLIYTRTRGAWLGVGVAVIAVAVVLYLTRDEHEGWSAWSEAFKRRGRLLAICGAAVLCASLLSPADKGELETLPLHKSSAASAFVSILAGQGSGRTDTWLQSLQMIVDHPIRGVGIGNWDAEYLRFAGPLLNQRGALFDRPHNDYLWVITEMGLPGLAVFVWIFVGGVWLVWDRLVKGAKREDAILLTALAAGVIAISIHAFFSFPRERIAATVIPYMLLGWISAVASSSAARPESRERRLWQPALVLVLSVVTLIPTIQVTQAYRAYFWADAFRTFGRNEDAILAIDAAIDYGVIDYRFYELKALVHHQLGDPERALKASEDLIAYHPYNPWSFHKVGLFHLELGNYPAARDAFKQGLEYGPGLGRIRRDLGQAYEALGQVDSARIAYEAALPRISDDALLHTRLAGLLAAEESYEDAQKHIKVAADRLKFTNAHADVAVVGDVAMTSQAYDDAVRCYQRAVTLVPEDVQYLSKLARALEAAGQIDRSIEILQRLLALATEEADRAMVLEQIERLKALPTDG